MEDSPSPWVRSLVIAASVVIGVSVIVLIGVVGYLTLGRPGSEELPPERPIINLSPNVGWAGTQITVTGEGWRPGETVQISLGIPGAGIEGEIRAQAVPDDIGRFTAVLVFPDERRWLDLNEVVVVAHTADFQLYASASFWPIPPHSLKNRPAIDAEHIDSGERALQHDQARLPVDPADGAPEHGGYQEERESRGDGADIERDQSGASDARRRADPLHRLQEDGFIPKPPHSRLAVQTTRPMMWTSSASRS